MRKVDPLRQSISAETSALQSCLPTSHATVSSASTATSSPSINFKTENSMKSGQTSSVKSEPLEHHQHSLYSPHKMSYPATSHNHHMMGSATSAEAAAFSAFSASAAAGLPSLPHLTPAPAVAAVAQATAPALHGYYGAYGAAAAASAPMSYSEHSISSKLNLQT